MQSHDLQKPELQGRNIGVNKTSTIVFSRLTSAGCALDPGSPMAAPGTTATGKTFRRKKGESTECLQLRYDENEAKSNRDNQNF